MLSKEQLERYLREHDRLIAAYTKLECSNCTKWMTKSCPSEAHRIVSCNEYCSNFELKTWLSDREKEKRLNTQAELALLTLRSS